MSKIYIDLLLIPCLGNDRCVIALIRGVNSKFPCPVCLVPGDQLINLSTDFPLRISSEMKKIHESTKELNIGQTDEILKAFGLRDVEVRVEKGATLCLAHTNLLPKNVFWKFPRTDIYQAISWDRLHAYHGGLFSDHIWEEVKSIAEDLGRDVSKLIDTQYVLFALNECDSDCLTGLTQFLHGVV